MGVFQKLAGVIGSFFQVGGPTGVALKNESGGAALGARNAADTAYAIVRGANPVGNNDLATKTYVDTLTTRTVVTQQFNGNAALPANTSTEQFYVVTTTGPNATIGQLLWDDGSGTGTTVVQPAQARVIVTTQAFTGGTITFSADTQYFWDVGATQWVSVSGTTVSGAIREIRYALSTGATQSSVTSLPANAVVTSAQIDVTTPYTAGTTISLGRTGSLTLLMLTTDSTVTTANLFGVPQDTAWGAAALQVVATVAGAPTAGAGFAIVQYTVPDA